MSYCILGVHLKNIVFLGIHIPQSEKSKKKTENLALPFDILERAVFKINSGGQTFGIAKIWCFWV
jgi:hypothetical protein